MVDISCLIIMLIYMHICSRPKSISFGSFRLRVRYVGRVLHSSEMWKSWTSVP